MESEYETAPKLSDGTNLNELDWLLTQISRSRYYSSQITQKLYKIELYIYNCGPIESRIWSIERRRFQWPCTTPNPVFQGHAILWAEYLINGRTYGHIYYGRRIGNRMIPVWMTFSDLFKVMIIQREITWKWYNNGRPIESRIWSIGRRHFQRP